MQDRGFNRFASNMIKLSVNETKWSTLLARTCALILHTSIWLFDFGPEKLPGLSRNGPLDLKQYYLVHTASKPKWHSNETFHLAHLVRYLFSTLGVPWLKFYNKSKTELTAIAYLSGWKTYLVSLLKRRIARFSNEETVSCLFAAILIKLTEWSSQQTTRVQSQRKSSPL